MADGEVRIKITADTSDYDRKLSEIQKKTGAEMSKAGEQAAQGGQKAKTAMDGAAQAATKAGDAAKGMGDKAKGAGEGAAGILGRVSQAGEQVSGKFTAVGERISGAAAKAKSSFSDMGGSLGGVGEKAASAFGSIGDKISSFGEKGKSAFSGLGNAVTSFGSTAETKVKGLGSSISDMGAKIADAGSKSGGIFSKLGSSIGSAVSGIGEKVGGLGTKIGSTFTNLGTGATGGAGAVKNALSGMGAAAEGVGSKIGGAFSLTGAAIAAGAAAAAKAVVDFTQAAIGAYGRYEQLSGGVDTLFKDSADTVRAYADEAYKTAGMSANQYMENITGFSASLLQSLGGDTKAAADMGNMAVLDMSDNANKMGSNIQEVERAYQGFARGQFGMLDNLKLGYGGTHSEAERLVDDANKIRIANGQAGDLSVDSFADVVQAIHEVQTEMGITGTTAEEAAHTIEGSIGTMQAAWENWLTGLANPDADMNQLTAELAESFMHVIENVVPAIGRMVTSIAQLIADGLRNGFNQAMEAMGLDFRMPEIDVGEAFSGFIEQLMSLAPTVQGAFDSILEGIAPFVGSVIELLGTLGQIAMTAMGMLAEAFASDAVASGIDFIAVTLQTLFDALKVVADTVTAFIEGVWTGFQNALADPMVQDAIAALQDAFSALMDALSSLMESLQPIISFLGEILPPIFSVLGEIIGTFFGILVGVFSGIVAGVTQIIAIVTEVVAQIVGFFTGTLPGAINGFFAGVQSFFSGVIGIINGIISAVAGAVGNVISAIGSCISNIVSTIAGAVGSILNAAIQFFSGFVDGVSQQATAALDFVSSIPDQIIGFLSGIDLFSIGASVLQGFLDGLKSIWSNITGFIGDIAAWILEHKGPIQKDRKLLIPAGKAIMRGLSQGLRETFRDDVMPLVNGMSEQVAAAFEGDMAGRLSLAGATLGVQTGNTVYSIVLDGNTINDRAGIIEVSRDYLTELHRKGVM